MYYTFVPDLSTNAAGLPAFLNRLMVLHIAQAIAIELSGSENRHEILHVQYVKALRRARTLEGRQGSAQSFIHDGNSRIIGTHNTYGSYTNVATNFSCLITDNLVGRTDLPRTANSVVS